MLFTSQSFILFLIVVFVVYYTVPRKGQWLVLLAANLVFYAASGWDNVLLITITIVTTWLAARNMDKLHRQREAQFAAQDKQLSRSDKKIIREAFKKKQKGWLLACLLINLGLLAVLKYTNFAIANVNTVRGWFGADQLSFVSLVLPLGLSFYTFQSVGYLIDVYRGTVPAEQKLLRFALFVSFFPQLVQGPISRFGDLSQSLFEEHPFHASTVSYGLQRVLWGFFKKVVIADRLLVGVSTIVKAPDHYQGVYVWLGMVFYAIQLYADFTGGIDITIGCAQALGITVRENFNRPYFSKSLAEFWRRWHMTMGTWFRDYLFYPLSISRPMLALSKKARKNLGDGVGRRLPVYLSTLLVWFTTGLWHGSSWNFIVWGLLNGVFIILSQELGPFYKWFHQTVRVKKTFPFRVFQVARTLFLVSALRLLDCYRDVALSFRQFGSMLTHFNLRELWNGQGLDIGLTLADYGVVVAGVSIMLTVSLLQRRGSLRDQLSQRPAGLRYALTIATLVTTLLVGAYGIGYDSSQFIYNQF